MEDIKKYIKQFINIPTGCEGSFWEIPAFAGMTKIMELHRNICGLINKCRLNQDSSKMRIISGSLKGRKLVTWTKKLPLRPMTDRVKESLFNALSPYLFKDCLFLDLFSGTGNLALEALSRGSGEAHAVEKHPLCVEIIKANSKILPSSKRLILHKKDVFSFIKQSRICFDIIVADPPFPLKYGEKVMKSLQKSFLTGKGTLIVVETGKEESLKELYKNFYLFSQKKFNDKKIWFYEHR